MKRVLLFGLSPFLINATDSAVLIVFNSTLQRYGGPQKGDMLVTCATIVMSYMQLISMPLLGISSGTQSILSFNYGAKKIQRIRQAEKVILLMAILFTTTMFFVSQTAPAYFVRIFTSDPLYTDLSVWAIRIYTAAVIPMAFQYTFVDGLTALGVPKAAVSLSLFRKSLLFLFIVFLSSRYGAQSAFFAEPISDFLGAIVSTITFIFLFNRLMRKREAMPDGQELYH